MEPLIEAELGSLGMNESIIARLSVFRSSFVVYVKSSTRCGRRCGRRSRNTSDGPFGSARELKFSGIKADLQSRLCRASQSRINTNAFLTQIPSISSPPPTWVNPNISATLCCRSGRPSSQSHHLLPAQRRNRTLYPLSKMPSASTRWPRSTTTSPTRHLER